MIQRSQYYYLAIITIANLSKNLKILIFIINSIIDGYDVDLLFFIFIRRGVKLNNLCATIVNAITKHFNYYEFDDFQEFEKHILVSPYLFHCVNVDLNVNFIITIIVINANLRNYSRYCCIMLLSFNVNAKLNYYFIKSKQYLYYDFEKLNFYSMNFGLTMEILYLLNLISQYLI